MPVRRPILVMEYLLADDAAWQQANASMRIEAAAMLTAIVQDLEQRDDVRPVVLMSSAAAGMLRSSGQIDSRTEIITSDRSPSEWLHQPTYPPTSFDASLIIAPECDGVLVSLLRQLQSNAWQATRNLNLPWPIARIFADKYRTFQWLEQHGIRTPPTKTLDDAAADVLRGDTLPRPRDRHSDSLPKSHRLGIIKPRDGAGSTQISLVPMTKNRFLRQPLNYSDDDEWVLQPFIPGVPCSVGFIGGGSANPTTILPPAEQDIHMDCEMPRYLGGQIPCSSELIPAVAEMAQQLATALGPFSGYVGADIVIAQDDRGSAIAHVIEINPRLCTSYVGYRAITEENLVGVFLQRPINAAIRWKRQTVRFDSDGKVNAVRRNHAFSDDTRADDCI